MSDRQLLRELTDAVERGEPAVLATVIATDRSVPRHAGSKMLLLADGRQVGSVGGGEMESRVIDAGREALRDGRTRRFNFDLVDPASGDPGVCGGSVSIYLEPYMPDPTLLVIGCGHVGTAVVELADWLGLRVVAIDDRTELARPELLPGADLVVGGPLADALAEVGIDERTHAVVVSRNVSVDLEVLPLLLASPAASIGVMGSGRRWATTRDRLLESGVAEEAVAQVRAPIGIELHAETPEEIALSILSEIVLHRRAPTPG